MSLALIALAVLAVWISLAFFRGRFWRADQRLNDAPVHGPRPEIVAVIPARNEAAHIGEIIRAHMACDYPARYSLILVDDQSSDGTADLARAAAEADPARELQIITSGDPPPGWTGKLWAVRQGLEKAEETFADYVLLTDADIVPAPDMLRRLVARAEDENLALASLMARLDASGVWGALLIPAFVYFFQMLYPFARVNDVNDAMAAAAGGVMLARKDALTAIGGVDAIRGELIDDCALARRIKDLSPATKIWLGLADEDAVSLRDNRELPAIWNMVARTAYAQLGHSPVVLAATLFGLALVYLTPPLIALSFAWHDCIPALLFSLSAWGVMSFTYWPTLKLYRQEPWQSALLPVAAALYAAMTASSAYRHWRGRGGEWKGRHY